MAQKMAHQYWWMSTCVLVICGLSCTHQDPLPPLSIRDESSEHGSQEIAASEKHRIQSNVLSSFVLEVNVCHTDLTQTFNRCTDKAL